jgi:hypothetical protein
MAAKRINPKRVKIHRSYTVDEAARLLDVHKNTIRAWMKSGLQTIDQNQPYLIHGQDLQDHVEAMRKKRRVPSKPGHMYCLKCRASRVPALGMVDYVPKTETVGDLIALCEACETTMNRRTRWDQILIVMPKMTITTREPQKRIEGM